jgi:hypothetical protein
MLHSKYTKYSKQFSAPMLCEEHAPEWFSQLKQGNKFEDFEYSSWPSTCHTNENMKKVCKIITEDWRSDYHFGNH